MRNLVTDNIPLQVTTATTDKLQILLTDMVGIKLMQQIASVSPGVNQLNIPIPANTASGTYIMQVQGAFLKKSLKLLVIK